MTQAKNMTTNGISPGMAVAINGSVATSQAVTATTSPTAGTLQADVTHFSSVASSGVVNLPAGQAGDTLVVWNQGGNALTVHPPTGATINDGASTLSIADNARAFLICVSATQWISILSA